MAELVCERLIPVDHPAFAGHFPGRPILPGVLLLAEMMEALSAAGQANEPMTIGAAKFLAPVGPGALLTISVLGEPGSPRRFEIRHAERLVASGSLGGPA